MQAAAEQSFKSNEDRLQRAYTFADLSNYSWKQRLAIRAAGVVFYLLNRLICWTIRWEVEGQKNWEAFSTDGKIFILTFWHNDIFAGTYFFQRRRIVVMTSQS